MSIAGLFSYVMQRVVDVQQFMCTSLHQFIIDVFQIGILLRHLL